MGKFYITTPLYYVNAKPHIGHAYTNVIADCMARFRRFEGDEVFFLTGTDEHGEKIKKTAQCNNQDLSEFIDGIAKDFKDLWIDLNISYDFFIRTTETFHKEVVTKVITSLFDKGDIYKKKYKGFYCVPCESFWTASQIKEASGVCPDCAREVKELEEENYFFKLSDYQGWLVKHLKDNPDCVRPQSRYNEVASFLEKNILQDLCISRPKKRLTWGIDFPGDDNYIVYVWFDALINYISGIGFGNNQNKFKFFWPADIHFMAKDILRHHAIFWPIMLKALDLEPPKMIFAHGWWKFQGEKISKSRGNIVSPLDLIKQVGVDGLRYFLLREVPIGLDGNFSWQAIINRVNSDLANDLGNLVYRTLNMSEKYLNAEVSLNPEKLPAKFKMCIDNLESCYTKYMRGAKFSLCLEEIFKFINVMNKHIEETKPWVLWKEKKVDEIEGFLYSLLESIRVAAVYLYPFIPDTSKSIMRQLGVEKEEYTFEDVSWGKIGKFCIKKEPPLFPRIDVN